MMDFTGNVTQLFKSFSLPGGMSTFIGILALLGLAAGISIGLGSWAVNTDKALAVKEAALETQVTALTKTVAALQTELDNLPPPAPATGSEAERYIETVTTLLTQPTGYNETSIAFALFYTKNESRVRVVITLPEGYLLSAADTVNADLFEAVAVLPAWACRVDARSDVAFSSWIVKSRGGFYFSTDSIDDNHSQKQTSLDNNPGDQGSWQASELTEDFIGNTVWLGVNECGNYNETHCFADFVAELVLTLSYQPDIDAWDAQYDAATP
jgi:hypothetical protein